MEFGCLIPSLHSVRFELLRCAHKRIVNIMKVYIEKNNVQMELIRFRKKIATLLTLQTLKLELGLYFRHRCAHCIRNESPLFGSEAPGVPDVSGHDHFGTECRSKCQFGSNSLLFTSSIAAFTRTRNKPNFVRRVG